MTDPTTTAEDGAQAERDIFDYEPGDADWIGYDDTPQCPRCRGDGIDPDCDYLLPCPDCGGSW